MDFECDPKKARSNYTKHGVDFAFATRVFADPYALTDVDDNEDEERETIVGRIDLSVFVVVFTMRMGRTRIITARKATRDEEKTYHEQFAQDEGEDDEEEDEQEP